MNTESLHKKLVAAARAGKPREDVPYAFEKRIMALIRSAPVSPDAWLSYSLALWRAAAPCLAIMLVAGTWVFYEETASQHGFQAGLESDLEQTMLAAVDNTGDTW
jgi:hypothetical protein